MAPGSIIPIVVAAHRAKLRRVLEAFRTAGATAPERARTLVSLGVSPDDTFAELESAGVIRPGSTTGTFYLDEARQAVRERSGRGTKMMLLGLLALVLAGLLVLVLVRPTII